MDTDINILVFVGSVRDSTPPRPRRLGARVGKACNRLLSKSIGVSVEVIDALEVDLPTPFKPHFAYAKGKAPAQLDDLAAKIEQADGYVMISPEYNHSMSPALADLLNHFGSSQFSYKPSVIVTYSAGQWGGTRAAVNMRTFLSELGCLPVSAMIHLPHAHEVLDENGQYVDGVDASRWDGYFFRGFDQLVWWAHAAKETRAKGDVTRPEAFRRSPDQRNAP